MSIRLRLTLWYMALLAGALVLFSATVYLVMASALVANLDTALQSRVQHVQSEARESHGWVTLRGIDEQTDEPAIPVVVVSPSGQVVQGALPATVSTWLRHNLADLRPGTHLSSTGNVRLALGSVGSGKPDAYVLVWQSTHSIEAAKRSLLFVLLTAGPALLVVAGFGGFALARKGLAPVAHMTHTASSISATDLSRRVRVGPVRDELGELAETFNAMIDRLERAVDRERRFTADASHELRSPLAVIRAETTLALDRPRSAEQYRRALAAVDEQAATMEELIGALLMLARVESDHPPDQLAAPIVGAVRDAITQVAPAAREVGVRIESDVPESLVVEGSLPLLSRAVRNILENGVKVSHAGDTIGIRGRQEGDNVVLTIEDQGPGITRDHLKRIFEPFYQVSPARTPGESHGLGLAICLRIVAAHGGRVDAESTLGRGTRFYITLPAAPGERRVAPLRRGDEVALRS